MPKVGNQAGSNEAEASIGPMDIARAQIRVQQIHGERCTKAMLNYLATMSEAGTGLIQGVGHSNPTGNPWQDATNYWLDSVQRHILFWDTLRQRGNNWIAHEKAGKPPLLDYEWEMIADARGFQPPVNYALVRIIPPEGTKTDPKRRPFVIIDPRAGHGPGIGGFKQDSQVGVALKAGHPVYFFIFFPEPMPGQTLADVSRAEAEFLRIVGERHPETGKPVVIGNCQGGWAAMLVGAMEPGLVGPIVINGAPMSYWAGNDGENPMRYAGGILGGAWTAHLASDLGAGFFDGAYLVDNFEYLNPANTYFNKFYNLYSKIDTEPERFLEFERWWGGFFMLNRQEITWIVDNLFIGNKLAAGEAEWSAQRAFDLRAIRTPIVLFASLGDNITPPQQALNWVADLYPTTEALKANGQVIVGLLHESVGHLGIFVSGQVARREHSQIVDLLDHIERLPPGLYGMKIEELPGEDGIPKYDVILTERRVEDLQQLQRFNRMDEIPFEAVKTTSDVLAGAYSTFLSPFIQHVASPASARFARTMNPQRVQRWAISDFNPMLWPLKGFADFAKANRLPRDKANPFGQWEGWAAKAVSAGLDLYREVRDAGVENMFFNTYSAATIGRTLKNGEEEVADMRQSAGIRHALDHIEEGDRTTAIIRTALLLLRAGPGRRRLSSMKHTRELVGHESGLETIPADVLREFIRDQSFIVHYEPELALSTLPMLLKNGEDRRFLLGLIERLVGKVEGTPEQRSLVGELQKMLKSEGGEAIELPIRPVFPAARPDALEHKRGA